LNRTLVAGVTAVALLASGAYRLTLDEPDPVAAKPKPHVDGAVYVLDEPVLVDLAGGGYATVTVGLQVESGTDTAEAQTAVVRDVVTTDLTGVERADLLDRTRRNFLKLKLARDIRKRTDIELDGVLLTDLTLK
jgi:flagellar protein FliL